MYLGPGPLCKGWYESTFHVVTYGKALECGHSQNYGPGMRWEPSGTLHFGLVMSPHMWAFTDHKAWGECYHELTQQTYVNHKG
jgi:hypothetical protein